jgi:hypothetical protein
MYLNDLQMTLSGCSMSPSALKKEIGLPNFDGTIDQGETPDEIIIRTCYRGDMSLLIDIVEGYLLSSPIRLKHYGILIGFTKDMVTRKYRDVGPETLKKELGIQNLGIEMSILRSDIQTDHFGPYIGDMHIRVTNADDFERLLDVILENLVRRSENMEIVDGVDLEAIWGAENGQRTAS